uniref:NADH-ubiquinone oxidoreductase chain 5 n=1 Tax=Parhyale hawaiensis TaxID=317513 RepID=Q6DVI6_9CRUS|nr:NADH dehydrogenase subunit 5 [Parhyale hawaiensis]AAT69313.1 NADH dehydrogenase subunit 5 [Parhyale hawaiensis]AYB71608.1 NADH dehydrogenase subunit 5 [Parhyale hawaiensis]
MVFNIFSFSLVILSFIMMYLSMLCIYSDYSLFIEWELMFLMSSSSCFSVIFDWMSLLFLGTVFLIAGSICKFSDYYMSGDKDFVRFMMILMMFVLSMVFLIISPNMMSILLGWDGLGLTSYALVIYYQNETSCNAGMLTVLSNRVGDVCILMSIGLMFFNGSWNFLFMEVKNIDYVMMMFIVLAGMTKSAQIPFSAWLPAAMAAPTPVSALVHSSTLVTAGVYLLIRFNNILLNSKALYFLLILSILTMFMSGWGANFETDMKKIIALSTLSQLGLMMMILCLGMSNLAFFHLITHAMFKSTLFMCGGVIIHMSNGSQDSRFMSTLITSSPVLSIVFSLTNMSLMGFPFLAGFYSKDLLLEFSFMNLNNFLLMLIVILGTGMTVAYSIRVLFLGLSNISNLKSVNDLSDNNNILLICMSLLFFMSIIMGFIFSWFYMWNSYSIILTNMSKYYILVICLIMGLFLFKKNWKENNKFDSLFFNGLSTMWFIPFYSTKHLNSTNLMFSDKLINLKDKGWFEYYGGQGGQKVFLSMSNKIQVAQLSEMIKNYLLSTIMIFIFILLMILK